MSPDDLPANVRYLARGRDEGIRVERQRILAILRAVGERDPGDRPIQDALREIERRIYDVDKMP